MEKKYIFIVAGFLLAISSPAFAEPGQVGIAAKAGTLGFGFEVSVDVSRFMEIRAGYNQVTFDFDTTISRIDYNFSPEFSTGSLLVDLHPFANAFHFTLGAYLNNNTIDINGIYRQGLLSAKLRRYADLIDQARVVGLVEFDTFAPYLGIGWTSNHESLSRWGVNMDLGIMFQGSPQVTELHVEDPWGVGKHPVTQSFIEQERQLIEDEIDEYQYYPVASISIS
ncbi:MAG: hypothetical protein D3910_20860, partial [Candidatus Electrothrix sp. ATG2]|nr:hypothetical protein [Candidatus Electrothrix sp. ATG2]